MEKSIHATVLAALLIFCFFAPGALQAASLILNGGFESGFTTTDIEQGPDGNLYVVSVTDNAIYKIRRVP